MDEDLDEQRQKEESEKYDLALTINLGNYLNGRTLTGKGKFPSPSAKQRRDIENISATLHVPQGTPKSESGITNRRRSTRVEDEIGSFGDEFGGVGLKEFDLLGNPHRIFVASGQVLQRISIDGSSTPQRRHSGIGISRLGGGGGRGGGAGAAVASSFTYCKRHLFLFTDVLLITEIATQSDRHVLLAVLPVKNMVLNTMPAVEDMEGFTMFDDDLSVTQRMHQDAEGEGQETFPFQIICTRHRGRGQAPLSLLFACERQSSRRTWVEDLENVILAYHRDDMSNPSKGSSPIGWYHSLLIGSPYAAAYTGDVASLRRQLRIMDRQGIHIDTPDNAGMSALHWAALRGHGVCVRLLLERGADVDLRQTGLNTPLLLASAGAHDGVVRLLLEHGADPAARNSRELDCISMTILYGHSMRGLLWTLRVISSRGVDMGRMDPSGASPLHLCAERSLSRPINMLVELGADVNAPHTRTQLTALHIACGQQTLDVETIRCLLDNGAYPNLKDLTGHAAFEIVRLGQRTPTLSTPTATALGPPFSPTQLDALQRNPDVISPTTSQADDKWRAMEGTIDRYGRWAVKTLPVLLEISKKGGRFDPTVLESLRPSFRAAVMEARMSWERLSEPKGFRAFVVAREQAGEDLIPRKDMWTKNEESPSCELCGEGWSITNRRHHCRSCGVLVCAACSSKRLHLSVMHAREKKGGDSAGQGERVCDACFNKLLSASRQVTPEHFTLRQLRESANDLVASLNELLESLDDPDGDPQSLETSMRHTVASVQGLDYLDSSSFSSPSQSPARTSLSSVMRSPADTPALDERVLNALKARTDKLMQAEDVAKKFCDVSIMYHRTTQRLMEAKKRRLGKGI